MRFLIPLPFLLACKSHNLDFKDEGGYACGAGTHVEGAECVADDDGEGDADTDADADGDADADADADTDADADGDSDADIAQAGLLVWASAPPGCDDYAAVAGMDYQNISTESEVQTIEARTTAATPWVSAIAPMTPGDAIQYQGYYSTTCTGSWGGVWEAIVANEGEMLVITADGAHTLVATEVWTEGVDYSPSEVMVIFESGTTSDYAESILDDYAVTGIVGVSTDPLTYLVEDEGGIGSVALSAELLSGSRITLAMPNTL